MEGKEKKVRPRRLETIDKALKAAKRYVRSRISGMTLVHTFGVAHFGRKLARAENANPAIIEMASLFHDIEKDSADFESHAGKAASTFRIFAKDYPSLPLGFIDAVCHCIESHVSAWVGGGPKPDTLEAKIVSDADMISQLGPFGIVKHMEKHFSLGFDSRIDATLADLERAYKVLITLCAKKIGSRRIGYVRKFISSAKDGV